MTAKRQPKAEAETERVHRLLVATVGIDVATAARTAARAAGCTCMPDVDAGRAEPFRRGPVEVTLRHDTGCPLHPDWEPRQTPADQR